MSSLAVGRFGRFLSVLAAGSLLGSMLVVAPLAHAEELDPTLGPTPTETVVESAPEPTSSALPEPTPSAPALTGTVTLDGTVLAGATVKVVAGDELVAVAETDEDGDFAFSAEELTSGDYLIQITADHPELDRWYPDAETGEDATPVTVIAGATEHLVVTLAGLTGPPEPTQTPTPSEEPTPEPTEAPATTADPESASTPDPALAGAQDDPGVSPFSEDGETGIISGTVTGVGIGAVEGVDVTVNDEWGSWVGSSSTGIDGVYTITDLPIGQYTVFFNPLWESRLVRQYWGGGLVQSDALLIEVLAGQTATASVELEPGGWIRGTVTRDEDGVGVPWVSVYVSDEDENYTAYGSTDSDGAYEISPLPAGSYVLRFDPPGDSGLMWQYSGGTRDRSSADRVDVAVGEEATADVALTGGGSISGRVTSGGEDNPVGNVYVYASTEDGWGSGTQTGEDGSYTISGLPSGEYRVEFSPQDEGYLWQYWGGTRDSSVAPRVTVTAPELTPDINADLDRVGSISGRVTTNGTAPLGDVWVTAYDRNYNWAGSASVSEDGDGNYNYTIADLVPDDGPYRLRFYTDDDSLYRAEWWQDKTSFDDATPIPVVSGATVELEDAVLDQRTSVSGRVLAAAGRQFDGVSLVLWQQGVARYDTYAYGEGNGGDGSYRFADVEPGTYQLSIEPWGDGEHLPTWYLNGDEFTVDEGDKQLDDIRLRAAAKVHGRITFSGGPLDGKSPHEAFVEVYRASDGAGKESLTYDWTQKDGAYSLTGLEPGDYYLKVGYGALEHIEAFTLSAGEDLILNFSVNAGASISGTVTRDGQPVAKVRVYAQNKAGRSVSAQTNSQGEFTIAALLPGSYTVRANDRGATRYLGNASTLRAAEFLQLGETDARTVTLDLAVGAIVEGKITDGDDQPVTSASVVLVSKDGTVDEWTGVDADGHYRFTGVPAGTYALRVSSGDGTHVGRWVGGADVFRYEDDAPWSGEGDIYFYVSASGIVTKDVVLNKAGELTFELSFANADDSEDMYFSMDLYRMDDGQRHWVDYDSGYWSGEPEGFTFGGLVQGDHVLEVRARTAHGYRSFEYSIPVGPGRNDRGELVVDVADLPAGGITGTLVAPDLEEGSEIWVYAESVDGDFWDEIEVVDGQFAFLGIPEGDYRLSVYPGRPYDYGYYPSGWLAADAELVSVGDDVVELESWELVKPTATLKGVVYAPDGVTPLPDAWVDLYRGTTEDPWYDWVDDVGVDGLGAYDFGERLVPGVRYALRVYTDDYPAYRSAQFVAKGSNTVDIVVKPYGDDDDDEEFGGSISGTVRDTAGRPVSDIEVAAGDDLADFRPYAYANRYDGYSSTQSLSNGTYRIDDLRAGDYRVRFGDYSSAQSYYAPTWLGGDTPSSAQLVPVGEDEQVTVDDVTLRKAGRISGAVSELSGGKQRWLWLSQVVLYTATGEWITYTHSGDHSPGGYGFTVAAGRYKVCVSQSWETEDPADACWSSTGELVPLASATAITVREGKEVGDIDLAFGYAAPVVETGGLSGTLTSGADTVVGAVVDACRVVAGQVAGCVQTTSLAGGAFTFTGLPVGAYEVSVSPPGSLLPATRSTSVAKDEVTSLDIELTAPVQIPPTTTLTSLTEADGVPVVDYNEDLTLTISGVCPTGTTAAGSWKVLDDQGAIERSGSFTLVGSELTATIPKLYPYRGVGHVVTEITCDGGLAGESPAFDIYIDPSGVVYDQWGVPVQGATVTLWRADDNDDPLLQVPNGSPIMTESNRVNPMTTAADGRFYWDVIAGVYQVRVVKPGCSSFTSPTMDVPPERVDLAFKLECGAPSLTSDLALGGQPKVGQTLTATLAEGRRLTSTVRWLRGSTPVGTGTTYVVTEADEGSTLTVEQTLKAPSVTNALDGLQVTFAALILTKSVTVNSAVQSMTPGIPTIVGTPEVGEELSANRGTWVPEDAQFAYQWLLNGVEIADAESSTYTPVATDLGKTLTVKVTASRDGYEPASVTSSGVSIAEGTLSAGTVSISGTPKLGEKLTAVPAGWDSGVTFSFKWSRGGQEVSSVSIYTSGVDDVGEKLSVTVTGSKAGYTSVSKTVESGTVAPGTLVAGSVTVSGTAKLGAVLTASAGMWGPATVATSYQWLRNGSTISGATSITYQLVAADVGSRISVKVTGSKAGYTSVSVTSGQTAAVAAGILTVGTVTITGTATVGSTLTANPGSWAPVPALTYQWLRDGSGISGATASTYKPASADVGKSLSVRVTGTKQGYTTASKTSSAVKVLDAAPKAVKKPSFTGTVKVGKTLKVKSGTWNVKGVKESYRWLVGGVSKGTGKSYKLKAADAGKKVVLEVTAKLAGRADGVAVSSAKSVPKLASSVSLKAGAIKPGVPGTVTVTVKVSGLSPTGVVKVLEGKKVLGQATLVASQKGKMTIPISALSKATHKLKATYAGSVEAKGSTSKTVTVKVK